MSDETPTLIDLLENTERNKRLLELQFQLMIKDWEERIKALNGFTVPKISE